MMRRSIASEWASYSKTLPQSASPTQYSETKRAFYAGVLTLFGIVMTDLSPGDEITDGDMALMDSIHEELDAFIWRIRAGATA